MWQTILETLIGAYGPFTRMVAARIMNQGDCHSVKRWRTPTFYIFIRSPVSQIRSYDRRNSKNVATVRLRWVDCNPSEMKCDSCRHWWMVLRPLLDPACQGLSVESSSSHHDRWLAMSLSKAFPIVKVDAIGRRIPTSAGSFPFLWKANTYTERNDCGHQHDNQLP